MSIKKETPMRFESLKIERGSYGSDAGKIIGRAGFRSKNASVDIKLNETHCQKIMDMCAEALLASAHDMAEVMKNDIIEGITVEKKGLLGRS